MDCWKCEVCAKSFTGLVCFQQHEASEKHKKKMQQMNGMVGEVSKPILPDLRNQQQPDLGNQLQPDLSKQLLPDLGNQLQCSVCLVSISGFDNFQKHVNSLDHALMVQKKSNDLLSQSVSNTFELKSEQKQHVGYTASLTSPLNATAAYAECKPCQKQFSGPEPYQQHLVSAGHKKKCGYSSNQIIPNYEQDYKVEKEKIGENLLVDHIPTVPSDNVPQSFVRCDFCQLQFSGAAAYYVHISSDGHKKKSGNELPGNAFVENQSVFKCEICSMSFTGPIPYQQHLTSNGHTKKVRAAEFSRQFATQEPLSSPDSMPKGYDIVSEQSTMNDLQNWYCDICKKQCSGPIPYNSHINSRDHLKNLRIQVMQENMKKVKELGLLPYVGNDEIDANLSSEVTSTTNLGSDLKTKMKDSFLEIKRNDLNINAKSDDTKILPDKFHPNLNDLLALPNLNIIPPEKLNVTVFAPDDEILFNNTKKCSPEFLSNV